MAPGFYLSRFHVLLAAISIGSAVGFYLYQKKKRGKPPQKWEQVGEVTELCVYPLKSGKRIALKRAEFTSYGIKQRKDDSKFYQLQDRELAVYNAKDFEHKTANTYPKLILIEVKVHDQDYYKFSAPYMTVQYVKRPKVGEAKEVIIKFWKTEKIPALDCGDEAATWLSRYILEKDSGLRLCYHAGFFRRDIETEHSKTIKFYKNFTNEAAGMFSYVSSAHIINESSVEDLNKRIGSQTISVYNFRPTVIVKCLQYSEDSWNWLKIGDVIFQVIQPCVRCQLTTIDPETGIRNSNGEPLKTLKTYRHIKDPELRKLEHNDPVMGVQAGVKKTGFIAVGDAVYVGA